MSNERVGVDAYVIDSLMPDLAGHDRHASAFLLYLYLWRRTRGGATSAVLSHQMMSEGTGLSKRGAQNALRHLRERGLVHVKRATVTSASTLTLRCEWRR